MHLKNEYNGSEFRGFTRLMFFGCVFLSVSGCTQAETGEDSPQATERTVYVTLVGDVSSAQQLGLTGKEPLFMGLGVDDLSGQVKSYTLKPGSNEVSVVPGENVTFKAALLTLPGDSSGRVLYSTAMTTLNVSADPTEPVEVSLNFSPYTESQFVNIYGLVHEDAKKPASGALIQAIEPFSGATISGPGFEFLSKTNEFGAYGFSFPVALAASEETLTLAISHNNSTQIERLSISDDGRPGYTVSAINLAGAIEVEPVYLDQNDFDGDGALNLDEIKAGTNPFSEISGANLCLDKVLCKQEEPIKCTADGQVGCVTTAEFKATAVTALSSKILQGQTVAGVTGTVVLPTAGQVQSGVVFGAASALTGSLVGAKPFCAADGQLDCTVPATGSIKAADTAGLSTKLVLGFTVAGEVGSVRLPAVSQVVSGVAYGGFDGVSGTVILPTASQVQTNVAFGAGGNLMGSYAGTAIPSCTTDGATDCSIPASGSMKAVSTVGLAGKVISTASVAGVTGTVVLPIASAVLAGTSYGPGSGTAGSYSPDFPAPSNVLTTDTTNNVSGTVVLPTEGQVQTNVTFGAGAGLTGSYAGAAMPSCTTDGATDCTIPASGSMKAVSTAGLADKVISTASVAGVTGAVVLPIASTVLAGTNFGPASGTAGTVVLPTQGQVQTGITFGASNALTGSLAAARPACTSDGQLDCTIPVSGSIKAVNTTSLSAKVLLGYTVAGEAGSVRLPAANEVVSTASYGVLDATSGTVVLPAAAQVLANVPFGADSLLFGSFAVPSDCATEGEFNCVVASASNFRVANTSGLSSKVVSGFNVAGQSGNVLLPAPNQVESGINFGAGGNSLTGILSPRMADCAQDGEVNCTIPFSGPFRAAHIGAFNEWDIRKKRNGAGAPLTFAGIEGKNKTCRNRVDLGLYNNITAPASADAGGPDFFDTIDDYSNGTIGLPFSNPAWSIPGVSGTFGADFKCGGIFGTGSVNSGNTGADGTLAHDPDGNWQDLTPGIIPGGGDSTNTANGCNATDKHCVFKELISGLMVTEVATDPSQTWQEAINYCHSLGEAGGVVSSPIPINGGFSFSDWRLPTQKELLHLYNAGIRGLNQTSNLRTNFGIVDADFWSASTLTFNTTQKWNMHLGKGHVTALSATTLISAICVR